MMEIETVSPLDVKAIDANRRRCHKEDRDWQTRRHAPVRALRNHPPCRR